MFSLNAASLAAAKAGVWSLYNLAEVFPAKQRQFVGVALSGGREQLNVTGHFATQFRLGNRRSRAG